MILQQTVLLALHLDNVQVRRIVLLQIVEQELVLGRVDRLGGSIWSMWVVHLRVTVVVRETVHLRAEAGGPDVLLAHSCAALEA